MGTVVPRWREGLTRVPPRCYGPSSPVPLPFCDERDRLRGLEVRTVGNRGVVCNQSGVGQARWRIRRDRGTNVLAGIDRETPWETRRGRIEIGAVCAPLRDFCGDDIRFFPARVSRFETRRAVRRVPVPGVKRSCGALDFRQFLSGASPMLPLFSVLCRMPSTRAIDGERPGRERQFFRCPNRPLLPFELSVEIRQGLLGSQRHSGRRHGASEASRGTRYRDRPSRERTGRQNNRGRRVEKGDRHPIQSFRKRVRQPREESCQNGPPERKTRFRRIRGGIQDARPLLRVDGAASALEFFLPVQAGERRVLFQANRDSSDREWRFRLRGIGRDTRSRDVYLAVAEVAFGAMSSHAGES